VGYSDLFSVTWVGNFACDPHCITATDVYHSCVESLMSTVMYVLPMMLKCLGWFPVVGQSKSLNCIRLRIMTAGAHNEF
jgi:hypothetical protein